MTIEIRQLILRATVESRSAPTSATGSAGAIDPGGRRELRRSETRSSLPAEDRQAIIDAAVREVLNHLERARER